MIRWAYNIVSVALADGTAAEAGERITVEGRLAATGDRVPLIERAKVVSRGR